jgi:hypothetical protein
MRKYADVQITVPEKVSAFIRQIPACRRAGPFSAGRRVIRVPFPGLPQKEKRIPKNA